MTDIGDQSEFIDTQDVSLRNSTDDNKIYIQLTDVVLDIDSNVTKHHLTDDTVDNVFDLRAISIQGNMVVTNDAWVDFVNLTVDIDGVRPIRDWVITWMSQSDNDTVTEIQGQLKTLRAIDSGIGAVQLFFRIEGSEALTIT